MAVEVKIRGIPDLKAALQSIPDKLRYRALRNALAVGARIVRDEARESAPVLSAANAARAPFRTPGLVRKSIVVRTSKIARRAGDVGVFVNVRPAPRGQRGAKSRTDPYYWRWMEFGKTGYVGRAFLQRGARRLNDALQVFIDRIGPQIQKLNGGKDVQL